MLHAVGNGYLYIADSTFMKPFSIYSLFSMPFLADCGAYPLPAAGNALFLPSLSGFACRPQLLVGYC